MEHVIVGAGPAGVIAAETLRRTDPSCRVTLINGEPEAPYSRMALPYYLIDDIAEEGTRLRKSADHYDTQGIELAPGRVRSVDAAAHTLSLEDGAAVRFDKLLIAAGSHPIRPPVPGLDLPGVHSCWTLEDGRNIVSKAARGTDVVLMGAGFIGCIILEALAMRGVNLTVIEMGDRMVPRMLDQTAGNLVKQWCLNKGVKVLTSTRVEAIEQDGDRLAVKLDNGEQLPAGLVISATGVAANTDFLEGGGIDTDFGVLVNDRLQSSHEDVYAAGDICQGKDFSTGEFNVQAIQPTAADHGRIAALNMAGGNARHQGSVNMNVLDTMGLISTSYGLWDGVDGGEQASLADEGRFRYVNLQFQDDVLVGAQALGLTNHVGVLRGLIQARAKLGKWKDRLLQDPTRIMEAYLGSTQAIGHNAAVPL